MSKKSVVERERKRVPLKNRYLQLRNFLKGKIKFSKTFQEKFFYLCQLQKLPRNSSFVRSL
jgi:hypothetical protein